MRKGLLLGSLGLVAILSMAVSVPTSAPPLEELAMAASPVAAVDDLLEGAQPRTIPIPHVSPERFENILIEPKCTCAVDFGALTNATLGTPCRESSTCTRCTSTNISIGQTCLASSDAASDGGSALLSTSQLSCRATTGGVVFKLCVQLTDAGSYDADETNFTGKIVK